MKQPEEAVVGSTEITEAALGGCTLGVAAVFSVMPNLAINPKINYSRATNFAPNISIAAAPCIISAHLSVSAEDYKGFLAEIKKHPGKYFLATFDPGCDLQTGTSVTRIHAAGQARR
jgi:tripartite-type tricarboxylate transporter receptor subunit TctC